MAANDSVKRVTDVSSNSSRACEHCRAPGAFGGSRLVEGINHYISEHGYRLLHVGPETHQGSDGEPWHVTVAILGTDDPPAVLGPVAVVVTVPGNRE